MGRCFPSWRLVHQYRTKDQGNLLKPQQAMFQTADNLSFNAFYIAADDLAQRDGRTWGIWKRYGAFRNATEFVTNFLQISPHRCFYEIIRNSSPCKAYLDAGAMSEQEGEDMCAAVNWEWKRRVASRWPAVQTESRAYDSQWQQSDG